MATIRTQGVRKSELAEPPITKAASEPSPPPPPLPAGDTPPAEATPPAGPVIGAATEAVVGGLKSAAAALDSLATSISPDRTDPETTGVIFVHGIGSQAPGETLLEWSGPIIKAITAWRSWAAPAGRDEPHDPVVGSVMDFTSELPTITLSIPAAQSAAGTWPETRWILTESWWAAKVAPPSLTTMTSWLGPQRGAEQIVAAILGNPSGSSPGLRAFQAAVVPFVSVLSGLILTLYGFIRTVTRLVPIQFVKDAAILREFDDFLTGWFGDVRILLFDPAQSANIRGGLASAVTRLRDRGCIRIVVVAHSGGAMVSYLTLTDPALARAQVDKLVTFGEGWNLALTLTPDGAGMADRLRRDITQRQPLLRWRDFWGSHDPAPAGALKTAQIDRGPGEIGPAHPDAVRSYRVWNRRSLLDDHGGYFDNDEEFTIPLLREIDVAAGWGEASRFYPIPEPDGPAVVTRDDPRIGADPGVRRRRQRVGLLAVWRHLSLCLAVAVVAIVLASPKRLEDLGKLVAIRLPRIPLVGDAVDWLRGLKALTVDLPVLPALDLLPLATIVGLATLQAIVVVSVLQLAAAPAGAYHAWPEGSSARGFVKGVEIAIALGLLASLVPLGLGPTHDRFLGAGGTAWLPGLVATALTFALAIGGPEFVRRTGKPAAARLFGVVSTFLFLIAMASAVITIFQRDGLEMAELGYVFIWVAFLALYAVGQSRWSQWDRVERADAFAAPDVPPSTRRPVALSCLGFLTAAAAIVAYVFEGPVAVVAGMGAAAIAMILVSIAWGGAAWDRSDAIAAPPPVDAAGV